MTAHLPTTPEEAWDDGYREDGWHLAMFGQYLPTGMIPFYYELQPDLTGAFEEGSTAHSQDDYDDTSTPNPYRKVKS